jgi:death on curing protein
VKEWIWVARSVVAALHDEQLAEHGGGAGLRDEGLLVSALARPRNLLAYGTPDVIDLAAAYAYGIAKNHPFIDGYKRTAAVVMELFLDLNGYALSADDASLVTTILGLADGSLSEAALAQWLRANTKRRRA